MEFPYFSARILTDSIFTEFGGHTGTSTASQRAAAYLIAEKQMSQHVGTFLPVITVTGTYVWPLEQRVFITEHSHILSIDDVTVYSQECYCDCDLETADGCGFIHSDSYGYVIVRQVDDCATSCGCCLEPPYQFRITYTAGLGSGTCYQPDMLLGLTIAAEIALMEMIDPGYNEGVGDIGIQSFSNQGYSENRVRLKRTAFGTSARANYVAHLVNGFRHYRALKLGY